MEQVNRYGFEDGCAGSCDCSVVERISGDYVDGDDYDALQAKYEVLEKSAAYLAWALAAIRDHKTTTYHARRIAMEALRYDTLEASK